jgi:ADP-heptose:LPS heptosyltransferase
MPLLEHISLLFWMLRPRTIFLRRSSRAMGDNLLLSTLLPALRLRFPRHRIVVETAFPELFRHHPHVAWATRAHWATTSRHLKPRYRVLPGEKHSLYTQLAHSIGLDSASPPQLTLLPREREAARRRVDGTYICLCPVGKRGFCNNRKEWGCDRFQELVDQWDGPTFVQIGSPGDPLLKGVLDLRGLSLRESAALLANASAFLGLEGGLMHLAKAVECPAVILYGGLVAREVSSYPDHVVLASTPSCAPCFSSEFPLEPCEGMECMRAISVEQVAAALSKLLDACNK